MKEKFLKITLQSLMEFIFFVVGINQNIINNQSKDLAMYCIEGGNNTSFLTAFTEINENTAEIICDSVDNYLEKSGIDPLKDCLREESAYLTGSIIEHSAQFYEEYLSDCIA